MTEQQQTETAILAGGCFWGMQDLIRRIPGGVSTRVGYTGGDVPNATDRNHGTHAEGIEVVFDPTVLSYRRLLEFFFQVHDPTTLNRQGADVATQYRSVIFYHDEDQKRTDEEVISELETEGIWNGPIVTEIAPFDEFYVAEDYHQNYFRNNGFQPYCQVIIAPKVAKFRKEHLERLKA